jgi:hypothetical protein
MAAFRHGFARRWGRILSISCSTAFPSCWILANTVKQRSWMRSLIVDADVAHELHWLDIPDAVCLERLRNRNAGGEHPFQVSDAEYAQFTSYFVPPGSDEGFHLIVHTA